MTEDLESVVFGGVWWCLLVFGRRYVLINLWRVLHSCETLNMHVDLPGVEEMQARQSLLLRGPFWVELEGAKYL